MPPSRFCSRRLVFLLLVIGAGFLAPPAEAAKRPFADIIDNAARRHGVDVDLVHAVIAAESGYRATAQSPAGAQGLMQLMPGTQRDLGVADAFDPRQNRVVCGRGRDPTLRSSTCSASVEVVALPFW